MNQVANNIITKRKALGFSQEYMADKLEMTSRGYQNYEYGRVPNMDKLMKIAEILNMSINDLLDEQSVQLENPNMDYSLSTLTRKGLTIVNPTELQAENARLKARILELEEDRKFLKELLKNSHRKS